MLNQTLSPHSGALALPGAAVLRLMAGRLGWGPSTRRLSSRPRSRGGGPRGGRAYVAPLRFLAQRRHRRAVGRFLEAGGAARGGLRLGGAPPFERAGEAFAEVFAGRRPGSGGAGVVEGVQGGRGLVEFRALCLGAETLHVVVAARRAELLCAAATVVVGLGLECGRGLAPARLPDLALLPVASGGACLRRSALPRSALLRRLHIRRAGGRGRLRLVPIATAGGRTQRQQGGAGQDGQRPSRPPQFEPGPFAFFSAFLPRAGVTTR